jgi:hypothetical protein
VTHSFFLGTFYRKGSQPPHHLAMLSVTILLLGVLFTLSKYVVFPASPSTEGVFFQSEVE